MKSLVRNSFYNIIYKCLNVAFPLITAAWVSRILMAEGVGQVSSAQNIVTYFMIAAALGLPIYGTKVIAEKNDSSKEQSKVFSELFIINLVSSIICTFAYYTIISSVTYFQNRFLLFAVCGLAIPFNIINVDWFYQGKEEYGYIMVRNLIVKTASVFACFAFVRTSDDYIIYALISTMAIVSNYIFNLIRLRKYVRFQAKDLNVAQHIKPVLIMLAASIAIEIYTLADVTMLTFFCNDAVVGYYSNAIKGVRVVKTLVVAVCAVFLPRLSYYYANNRKTEFDKLVNDGIKILAIASIPAAAGMTLVAGEFIPVLFGDAFIESIPTTRILTISIVSVAFSNFFGSSVLVVVGKAKHMMISTIIGAVVNVILNFSLIFSLQHNGVAIASVIAEICVTLYQIYAMKGVFNFKIDYAFAFSVLLSTIVMSTVVEGVLISFSNAFFSLTLSIILGAFVYMTMLILTKNSLAISIKNKIF